jgi:hypothetical protein
MVDIFAPSARLRAEDSLRATLLSLVLHAMGDDYLELVEGTAPSDQRLDSARWLTRQEERGGLDTELDELLCALDKRLGELGLRAMLYVASDGFLLGERRQIQSRLYGSDPDAEV